MLGLSRIEAILGYGCNVPVCFYRRVMDYPTQKVIAAFRTHPGALHRQGRGRPLGLVITFVSTWWALALRISGVTHIVLLG